MRSYRGVTIASWKLFPIPRHDDVKYRRHRQFLGTPKGVGSRRKEKFYGSVLLCMNGHQQRAEIDWTQFLFNGGGCSLYSSIWECLSCLRKVSVCLTAEYFLIREKPNVLHLITVATEQILWFFLYTNHRKGN